MRNAQADDELAAGIAAVEDLLTASKNAMSRMYGVHPHYVARECAHA